MYVSDETTALENVRSAKLDYEFALAEHTDVSAKYEKKLAAADSTDKEVETLLTKIKGLLAIKEVTQASGRPVPPTVLSDIVAAQCQVPGLQDRAARKRTTANELCALLPEAKIKLEIATDRLKAAHSIAKQLVPNYNATQDEFAGLFDRLQDLPDQLRNMTFKKALGIAANVTKQHAKTVAMLAAPVALLASPLRQPIIAGSQHHWEWHINPVLGQVKTRAVDPLLAKLPDSKLDEKREFVQQKIGEAKADPVNFAKTNVPALAAFLLETGKNVAVNAWGMAQRFKIPAVGLLYAHDRVMTRKFFEKKALLDLMASRLGDAGSTGGGRMMEGVVAGEAASEGAGGISSAEQKTQEKKNQRPEAMNGIIGAFWKNLGHKFEAEITKHINNALEKIPFASLKVDSVKLGKRSPWFRELKKLATRSEQEIQIVGVLRWVMEDGAGIKVGGHLKQAFMPTSLNLEHFDLELPVWIRLRVNKNWGREPLPGQQKGSSVFSRRTFFFLNPQEFRSI